MNSKKDQNSKQSKSTVLIGDEPVRLIEYREPSYLRTILFALGCIFSLGILALVCHWWKRIFLRLNYRKCSPKNATKVIVIDEYGNCHSCTRLTYEFNGQLSNIFTYKHLRYSFDESGTNIKSMQFPTDKPFFYYENIMIKGIQADSVQHWRKLNGMNSIEVPVTPLYKLILDEGLHPFICFQIFSIVVWSLYDYYYYAALIAFMTIISVITQIYQTVRNMNNLHEMTKFHSIVKVLRRSKTHPEGEWLSLPSQELVPGDVFEVTNDLTLSCDALLLSGAQTVMNETMLTGESVPIVKTGIPHTSSVPSSGLSKVEELHEEQLRNLLPTVPAAEILDIERDKTHILFSGTRTVRVRGSMVPDTTGQLVMQPPLCVCLRTGFSTAKGQLVRSILYPKPTTFKFYEDSFKFIGVLAMLAFVGFIVNAVIQTMYGEEALYIILRAGDLVTIAVPPTLPAVMSAGVSYAISRLKKKNIYCITSQRVNMAGKVKVMCFDKTGTLTEEDLSVLGIKAVTNQQGLTPPPLSSHTPSPTPVPSSQDSESMTIAQTEMVMPSLAPSDLVVDTLMREANSPRHQQTPVGHPIGFTPLYADALELSAVNILVSGMSCCHSVANVDGVNVGDPLDVKMFEFTKWSMVEKGQTIKQSTTSSSEGNPASMDLLHDVAAHLNITTPLMSHYEALLVSPETIEAEHSDNSSSPPVSVSPHVEMERITHSKRTALGILRRFEFSSHLQRMSVIAQRSEITSPSQFNETATSSTQNSVITKTLPLLDVFVKGSPELLQTLCDPKTLPADFDSTLSSFTRRGLRVIALAHRTMALPQEVGTNPDNDPTTVPENITVINALRRDEVEQGLSFLGFFILENKLKPSSTEALKRLTDAGIRSLMITGDNVYTALNIARECTLIPSPPLVVPSSAEEQSRGMMATTSSSSSSVISTDPHRSISVPQLDEYPVFLAELNNSGEVTWRCSDYPNWTLDRKMLCPVLTTPASRTSASPPVQSPPPQSASAFAHGHGMVPNASNTFSETSSVHSANSVTVQPSPYASPAPSYNSLSSSSTYQTLNSMNSGTGSNLSMKPLLSHPQPSNPSLLSTPSTNTLSKTMEKLPSKETTMTSPTEGIMNTTMDPFSGWNGGPWGPLYWRGMSLPETFSSAPLTSPPPSCYFLAVTGPAFRKMYDDEQERIKRQEEEKLETASNSSSSDAKTDDLSSLETSTFKKVCFLAPVFARMSPDDKAHLVETLISMGFITGMCGDGANDCGALKAAHVGISLSEVEASIAAPFTSKIASIACVETLILEGRASLSSSFHAFKATAAFSMIQFISSAILIGYDTMLSDFGFLVLDVLMTLPVLFTTGYARPASKLTKKTPQGALVSFPVISSLALHIIVTFLVQFGGTIAMKNCIDYVPLDHEEEDYDLHIESFETTCVFLTSMVSYVISGTIINLKDKFLEPLYRNLPLCISFLFVTFCAIFTFATKWDWYVSLLQMVKTTDFTFYLYCIIACVVSFALLFAFEYGVCQNNLLKKIYRARKPTAKHQPKVVKVKPSKSSSANNTCPTTRLVYKKPYYALLHEMHSFGKGLKA